MSNEIIFTNVNYIGNAGDYWCSPLHYYDFSFIHFKKYHYMDIVNGVTGKEGYQDNKLKNRIIVIGGGGLLTSKGNFLQDTLEYLIDNNKVILWGIGSNTYGNISWDILNHENVILGGIRDTDLNLNMDYLPCVSCKHPLFDKVHTSSQGTGILEHARLPVDIEDLPRICNKDSMENIINFISSKESLISTTFHGVYWSQLLNKKVVAYSKEGKVNSKITNGKHRIMICNNSNYAELLDHSSSSQGLLKESRYLNDNFFNKFKQVIKEYT